MSLTCPHCRKAAYRLHIIKKNHPELPIFMVLAGREENEKSFFKETKSKDVPYMMFHNEKHFIEMAGETVPAIFWVNNSIIERKSNYFQLDPSVMQEWLAGK